MTPFFINFYIKFKHNMIRMLYNNGNGYTV